MSLQCWQRQNSLTSLQSPPMIKTCTIYTVGFFLLVWYSHCLFYLLCFRLRLLGSWHSPTEGSLLEGRKKRGQHQVALNEVEAAMIHCSERWEFSTTGKSGPRISHLLPHERVLINPAASPHPSHFNLQQTGWAVLLFDLSRGQEACGCCIGLWRNQVVKPPRNVDTKGVGYISVSFAKWSRRQKIVVCVDKPGIWQQLGTGVEIRLHWVKLHLRLCCSRHVRVRDAEPTLPPLRRTLFPLVLHGVLTRKSQAVDAVGAATSSPIHPKNTSISFWVRKHLYAMFCFLWTGSVSTICRNANRSVSEVEYIILWECDGQDQGPKAHNAFIKTWSTVAAHVWKTNTIAWQWAQEGRFLRQSVRITHSGVEGCFFSDSTASSALTAESEQ